MKHYTPMISGDEVDAFSRARRFMSWKPGERKRIKRGYRRRERRELNDALFWVEDQEPLNPWGDVSLPIWMLEA